MKPILFLTVSVFSMLAAAVSPAVLSQKSAPQSVANGKRIFHQSCSACHNAIGLTAKSGPSLEGYYRRQSHPTDSSVRAIIQQGKGTMPAFTTLNQAQMENLLAYLKTL